MGWFSKTPRCGYCGHHRAAVYCASCGKAVHAKIEVREISGDADLKDKRRRFKVSGALNVTAEEVGKLPEVPRIGEHHWFGRSRYSDMAKEKVARTVGPGEWDVVVRYG
jgi:ribosomal protein L37E